MSNLLCAKVIAIILAAVVVYGSAAEEGTGLAQQLEQAAAVATAVGGSSRADAIYKQATIDHPDSAEAWAAYGEHLRFYAHDEKAATAAFQRALDAKEKDANASAFALRGLGELASKAQQDDLAIEYFKKSLLARPLADTHRSFCHLYCRRKEFSAAAEQARAAVKLNPADPIALLLYAAQLHRAGQAEEGRRQYDQALTVSGMAAAEKNDEPVHCCVVYNAAGYLAVTGDEDAALCMLKKFFETPNHRHLSRAEIESDSDFESLKLKPAFAKLLDQHLPASPAK